MGKEEDEVDKAVREKWRTSFPDDFFKRMEYYPTQKIATVAKEFTTPNGETIFKQEMETTVDPYTFNPTTKIKIVTKKCRCGNPITTEMMTSHLIQLCTICGEQTCVSCRASTDREYIKPKVRGQSVCKKCWNNFAQKMIIKCPTCQQQVKEPYDVKLCVRCHKQACPSCGVQIMGGGLICVECHNSLEKMNNAQERLDSIFEQI